MSDIKLTSEKVREIFFNCLCKEEEIRDGKPTVPYIIGQGVLHDFAFVTERLESYKDDISTLLDQIISHEETKSFLNLCMDKDGIQWGEHINMEQLVALGIANGELTSLFPKDLWRALPGGMPILVRNSRERKKVLE